MRTQKPERPALELDDYSGPFRPDLHISDFSEAGLMKLVEIGGSIYGAVNRQWYRAAVERFGQEVADEMHHEVWFADGGAGDHENTTISKLMGFESDDDADPGEYGKAHGLERDSDAEIVNREAGKYSKRDA